MFGQLSGRESLRDLVTVLEAHQSKCYHLGLGDRPASRNAVSLANQTRDCRIFEEFASFMMEEAGRECAADVFGLGGNVYAFDSTTIPLCLPLFPWARFRRQKRSEGACPLRPRDACAFLLPHHGGIRP